MYRIIEFEMFDSSRIFMVSSAGNADIDRLRYSRHMGQDGLVRRSKVYDEKYNSLAASWHAVGKKYVKIDTANNSIG